jgi:hypothetical protein
VSEPEQILAECAIARNYKPVSNVPQLIFELYTRDTLVCHGELLAKTIGFVSNMYVTQEGFISRDHKNRVA